MIPNREEPGKWGRSGKCFSRAVQTDTVIPGDISPNHHLEARVTVRTLPPLPPLPPFWAVDEAAGAARQILPPVPAAQVEDDVPTSPAEDAEEAERLLRVEASLAFERDEVVQQSIPHKRMIAGLLAAAWMRPKLVIEVPLVTADPWASGVARLQTMEPLVGFSPQQWKQVQHGCAALLASHGLEMTRLGWTTEDGFGIHPEVGGNAAHCFGLGLLLGDGRVIEMTEAAARIELRSGMQQSFTRRSKPWAVPIWAAGHGTTSGCRMTTYALRLWLDGYGPVRLNLRKPYIEAVIREPNKILLAAKSQTVTDLIKPEIWTCQNLTPRRRSVVFGTRRDGVTVSVGNLSKPYITTVADLMRDAVTELTNVDIPDHDAPSGRDARHQTRNRRKENAQCHHRKSPPPPRISL